MALSLQAEEVGKVSPYLSDLIIESQSGSLVNGMLTGTSHLTFKSGNTYDGEMRYHEMDGQGVYRWGDVTYEGVMTSNHIRGQGTLTWPDGGTYSGELLDGQRHGSGVYRCPPPSSVYYEGEWHLGKRQGKGRLVYKEGSFYEGDWENGEREGFGVIQYDSGNQYEGDWQRNRKTGKGKMVWRDRNELYEGEWREDLPHGRGSHYWLDDAPGTVLMKNHYHGEFEGGERSGFGVFYYADGSRYEGFWKQNHKEGANLYFQPNGHVVVQRMSNDCYASPPMPSIIPEMLLDDLYERYHSSADDKKQFQNLLLRRIEALHRFYNSLSALPDREQPFYLFCLTERKLSHFLRLCCTSRCPLHSLIDVLREGRRLHYQALQTLVSKTDYSQEEKIHLLDASFEDRELREGSPHRIVLFHEFLESLIRIACSLFGSSDRSGLFSSVDSFFQKYLDNLSSAFPLLSLRDTHSQFFQEANFDFQEVFLHWAHLFSPFFSNDVQRDRIPALGIIQTLRKYQILPQELSLSDSLQLILGYKKIDFSSLDCYHTELMMDETTDALIRVSQRLSGGDFSCDSLRSLLSRLLEGVPVSNE